jgi:hypothetical protein
MLPLNWTFQQGEWILVAFATKKINIASVSKEEQQ